MTNDADMFETQRVQPAEPEQEPLFAIVELFGHARIAGRVSEQVLGGASFVRVDVPEVSYLATEYESGQPAKVRRTIPAHTRSFGAKAIYSINWTDEAAARAAAHGIKHEPLQPYALRDMVEGLSKGARSELLGYQDVDTDD